MTSTASGGGAPSSPLRNTSRSHQVSDLTIVAKVLSALLPRPYSASVCRYQAPHGYASLRDVRSDRPSKMDRMESFFLAETLKYLYLLQDPTRPIKLDTHVFNTEAHPFSIPAVEE